MKFINKVLFQFFIFSILIPVAYSQKSKANTTLNLDSVKISELLILRDRECYNINQVIERKNFSKFTNDIFESTDLTFWIKFDLENTSSQKINRILQIGQKRHSDFSEMFIYQGQNLTKHSKSGHFEKKSDKEIKKELCSKFYIEIEPKSSYTFYFKITNISGFKPSFELSAFLESEFQEKISSRNLEYGILIGILLIMFLYNFLIFIYSKDREYLYYSVYLLGIAFNILTERGLFTEFFLPEYPLLNPYVFIISTGIASVFYFAFIRLFLSTKNKMPFWHKAHFIVIIINLIISLLLVFELFVIFNINFALQVSNMLNLVGLVYGLVFLVYLMKNGDKLSRFFVVGNLFLAVGTITSIIMLVQKVDIGIDLKLFMYLGTIIQILMFSLGLGYKIKISEKEKLETQEKLIKQLETNDELKTKVNRELEQKVKERTFEIEGQKQILANNAKELQNTNNLLVEKNEEINQQAEELFAQTENLELANKEINAKKILIEEILEHTTSSINYASRIQAAMLPEEEDFKVLFKDYFILFKPRDIVSGDFFWIKNIKDRIVIAAADCTGHGVPGAFVSMLGISLLNEIIRKETDFNAAGILNLLRDEIKDSLKQVDLNSNSKDGIDMALCTIDKKSMLLEYAGAHNPLYLFRNGELSETKPDRMPVGVNKIEKPFVNNIIPIQEKDRIYLFSDGYIDQFGGKHYQKFKTKRFKELLTEIQKSPLSTHKQILETELSDWQGQNQQIDDIIVMAVEI